MSRILVVGTFLLALVACSSEPTSGVIPDRGGEDCARPPCTDGGRDSTRDAGAADTNVDVAADAADAGVDGGTDDGGVDGGDDAAGADAAVSDVVASDVGPVEVGPPDVDSDGDGIMDRIEGDGDFDEDGVPNRLDEDSDNDGIPDRVEYRRELGSGVAASDLDGDRSPDFLDLDSDGDGLLDEFETGCPSSTEPDEADSDVDGFIDTLEVAFGSDPCDPTSDINEFVDFFFELPFNGPEQTAELDIETTLESGDVVFNMDVTGSMALAIESLKTSLRTTIIPELSTRIVDVGIGVTQFADFPCDDHGSSADRPFRLMQRVTSNAAAAQAAVTRLSAAGGGDGPESGYESLYQLASGLGRVSSCSAGNVPAFNPAENLVAGVADGTDGGAGFRDSEVRVAVHITDAESHVADVAGYGYGASRAETYAALTDNGVRVIGLALGESLFGFSSSASAHLTEIARQSGAVVEPCAWGTSRPAGCSASQCCTGVDGAGRAPEGGVCPLVFQLNTLFSTPSVDASVISGIEALLGGSAFDVSANLRRDEEEFAATGVDTTCFISGVVPIRATSEGCALDPVPADLNGDGTLDGFTGVAPGSSVTFEIRAANDCVPQVRDPQVFLVWIDLITSEGTSLGEKLVTILVPPRDPKG